MFTRRKPNFGRGRNQDYSRRPEHSRGWTQDYRPSWNANRLHQTSAARRGDPGKSIVCFKCNQVGHIVKNCPFKAEGGGIALISSTKPTNEWFIDSAATKQMTHDRSLLINYEQYKTSTDIYLGDNTAIKALGEGMVKLPTGSDFHLELHKVLYVPKLAKNLLSVPAMASMGAEVQFDDKKCIISKEGKDYVIGKLVDGMLYTVNTVDFAQSSTEQTPEVWHQRLGHLNNNYVHQLAKKEMVTGMNYPTNNNLEKECEGCTVGKMHRNPFPKQSQHRATKLYEVIHSDVCGPMQVESKGGNKYMVTFTDDNSRYATVYFIKNKDEVLTKFKEYVSFVENQSGNRGHVKILRSDNGGEYTSNNFVKYCAEKGISHEFTSPYCPEQNGVAERLNRTIMESVRSMIYHAGLPLDFWAEACSTAVYIHNRSPTTALKDKTPYECLFGRKPDISNLRVFGCKCYVHVPDCRRQKLDRKSYEAIFVGYPQGTKGYKIYDFERKRFMINRDVTFFEKKFHYIDESKLDRVVLSENLIIPEDNEEIERSIEPENDVDDHEIDHDLHPDTCIHEPMRETDQTLRNDEQPTNSENVEQVGEIETPSTSKTYEELFMENVQNLGPVRQRKVRSKFRDDACPVIDSLTSEIDEPVGVQDALNSEHSEHWKNAMISEYSSLMENETWELVPPSEDQNIVGSRLGLKGQT